MSTNITNMRTVAGKKANFNNLFSEVCEATLQLKDQMNPDLLKKMAMSSQSELQTQDQQNDRVSTRVGSGNDKINLDEGLYDASILPADINSY